MGICCRNVAEFSVILNLRFSLAGKKLMDLAGGFQERGKQVWFKIIGFPGSAIFYVCFKSV